jgi:tRNA (adenine37-N6)-methyltransferase
MPRTTVHAPETDQLIIRPIGVIHTPYTSKYAAPRQPGTAAVPATGVITLDPDANFEQALEDLAGFDLLWIVFWFHLNSGWRPKVLPPDGGRKKRGVFATRSPHRPNPIGLSLCRLLEIRGRVLTVENPDMLDGTPVLDIKPYLPHAEAHPGARSGWIAGVHEKAAGPFAVSFSPEVERAFHGMDEHERDEVSAYLHGVLARDPFPHAYRRIKPAANGTCVIAVRLWRFAFVVEGDAVRVLAVDRVPA